MKRITKEEFLRNVKKELGKSECTLTLKDLISPKTDEEFLENAYLKILQRPADPVGRSTFLTQLKSGSITRKEVIIALRFSGEGEKVGVKIKGLEPYVLMRRFGVFALLKRLKSFIVPFLYFKRAPSIISNLEYVVYENSRSIEAIRGIVEDNRALLEKRIGNLDSSVRDLEGKIARLVSTREIDLTPEEYEVFEEKFRGKSEDVKNRLSAYYLKFVKGLIEKFGSINALDIGCGRGEWIEMVQGMGVKIVGIDINEVFVEKLREQGLNALRFDLFDFLEKSEPESFHLITAFHVIEHIDISRRAEFLRKVYRALKKGGMAIIETPNPRNILVGGGDFYRDPSHIVPLFPDTLQLIGSLLGFSESRSYFLGEFGSLIDIDNYKFDSLDKYLNVSRDFVWIGKK